MEPDPPLSTRLWLNAGLGLLMAVLLVTTVAQGRHGARMQHAIRSTPAAIDAHISQPRMHPLDNSGNRAIRGYMADMWSDSPGRLWIVQNVAARRRHAPPRPSEAAAGDAEDLMHDVVGGSVNMLIVSGAAVFVEPLDEHEARRVQNVPYGTGEERHYYSHADDPRRRPYYPSGIIELCCRRRSPSVEPIHVFPTDVALDEGVPHMSAATAAGGDEDDIRRWRAPRRYHVLAYQADAASQK